MGVGCATVVDTAAWSSYGLGPRLCMDSELISAEGMGIALREYQGDIMKLRRDERKNIASSHVCSDYSTVRPS